MRYNEQKYVVAKTLIKDTLLALNDPAAAMTRVNAELCANNPANMFLTAWVGVLDLETGIVTFVNAGHNPPVVVSGQERPEVTFVKKSSGPVLACLGSVRYQARTLRLAPGDALFLYTDGVTEAVDSKGVLFGEDRMVDALKVVRDPDPHALCSVVRTVVAAFSEGLPQADDITVLAIRYFEPPKLHSRRFPPQQEGIADASAFLDETLEKSAEQVPKILSLVPPLHVILDEVCSNIVKHSNASGFRVDIEIRESPPGVKMTFVDDGTAYDPLAHIDPDTTLPAEERPIGGLGILMVKKMSSALSYRRANGRNILIVERTA